MPERPEPTASEQAGGSGRLSSRSIRSFVIRNGRMTDAQEEALERLWPRFGLNFSDTTVAPDTLFQRSAPCWLEVGFGNGAALLDMAEQHPEINFLGVEVHAPGVGHALLELERRELLNVRLVRHDAIEVLQQMIPPASLARVLLFFPDPWIKKRHHKRRIVQNDFLTACVDALEPGGELHAATDVDDYAEWILDQLSAIPELRNTAGDDGVVQRPSWRPLTRFEQRGQRLGHRVHDLLWRRAEPTSDKSTACPKP